MLLLELLLLFAAVDDGCGGIDGVSTFEPPALSVCNNGRLTKAIEESDRLCNGLSFFSLNSLALPTSPLVVSLPCPPKSSTSISSLITPLLTPLPRATSLTTFTVFSLTSLNDLFFPAPLLVTLCFSASPRGPPFRDVLVSGLGLGLSGMVTQLTTLGLLPLVTSPPVLVIGEGLREEQEDPGEEAMWCRAWPSGLALRILLELLSEQLCVMLLSLHAVQPLSSHL